MGALELSALAVIVPLFAAVGGYAWHAAQVRTGWSSKRVLVLNLLFLAVLPLWGCVGFFTTSIGLRKPAELYVLAVWFGMCLGSAQAFGRAVFSELIPKGHESDMFALFEITDSLSSWMGPLIAASVVQTTGKISARAYLPAVRHGAARGGCCTRSTSSPASGLRRATRRWRSTGRRTRRREMREIVHTIRREVPFLVLLVPFFVLFFPRAVVLVLVDVVVAAVGVLALHQTLDARQAPLRGLARSVQATRALVLARGIRQHARARQRRAQRAVARHARARLRRRVRREVRASVLIAAAGSPQTSALRSARARAASPLGAGPAPPGSASAPSPRAPWRPRTPRRRRARSCAARQARLQPARARAAAGASASASLAAASASFRRRCSR